jgi:hypothetical protein
VANAFALLYKSIGKTKLAPPSSLKNPARGGQRGGEKDLEEFAYTAPARLSFYSLSMVTPYLYSVLMFIMPGRIFSTLSFCFCSVVCSSEELQYYFRHPAALPLPVYLDKRWGKFTFTGSLIATQANVFTLMYR